MAGKAITTSIYQQIMANFPRENLRMAFAYGSGVFQQRGHADMNKNMLDFVFVVDEPVEWHRLNMIQNNSHYSFLKFLGPESIARFQDQLGARVYYNTMVPCEGRLIKYGVIKTDWLINDLFDWETLYVSGRLHKPVKFVYRVMNDTTDLPVALTTNLNSALHTALLLLDESFTEEELYTTIANLSYSGDFRMVIGEDKNKVQNIVKPNVEQFQRLYASMLESEDHLHWNKSSGCLEQSLHSSSQYHHLNLLPLIVQAGLVNYRNTDGRSRDTEEVLRSFAHDTECREVIRKCISGIVKQSSITQSLKGLLTAGIVKSFKYSLNKLKKMSWAKRSKV